MIRNASENCNLKRKCEEEKNLSPYTYNSQCHIFPHFFLVPSVHIEVLIPLLHQMSL